MEFSPLSMNVSFYKLKSSNFGYDIENIYVEAPDVASLLRRAFEMAAGKPYVNSEFGLPKSSVAVRDIHGIGDLPLYPKGSTSSFRSFLSGRLSALLNSIPGSVETEARLERALRITDTLPNVRAVAALMAEQPIEARETTAERLHDRDVLRALVTWHGIPLRQLAATFASEGVTYAELCAHCFLRESSEIPTELPDGDARQTLHEVLVRLSGNGTYRKIGEDLSPGLHQGDFGTCGNFAQVVDEVLEAGGHYIVVANPQWNPDTIGLAGHVAVRVGDFIADCRGVHDWAEFVGPLGGEGIHEPILTSQSNLFESFRRQLRKAPNLDVKAFRRDLKEAVGIPLPRREIAHYSGWGR